MIKQMFDEASPTRAGFKLTLFYNDREMIIIRK